MFKKYSLFLKNQYVEYTYEQSWNVDLSWKNHPLPFQFIHWTHEEKLHLESFCNLQPLDWPYKIKPFAYRESLHVASVLKFTLLNATKIIVEHFGILPTPWPYKSIHSTYGSSWHVDSFYWIYLPCPLQNILFNVWISMASWLMLNCSLPSPTTKPYIEHMKKRNLESFLKFTAHRPYKTTRWTYGEISHVEWCLGFPSLRPCRTNGLRYEETCHAESFLKSTSPRPYLASTPFNKWTNLACWVIVKDLLPCALQKYTFKVVQQTNLFGILRRVQHVLFHASQNLEDRNKVETLSHLLSSALPHKNNILNTWGQFSAWVISQVTNFSIYSLFRSYKAICSTLEESWHVESLLRICPPRPYKTIRSLYAESYNVVSSNLQTIRLIQHMKKLTCWVIAIDLPSGPLQNTLFDIWTDLASWVMFEMSLPSPTTKQDVERTKLELRVMFGIYAHWTIHSNTFNIWIKLTCWFILLDLPALSPTKRYV